MRRRLLSGSQASRSASLVRSQQKQFKVDLPQAPASGKMIFMKRALSSTAPVHDKRTHTDREIHDDYEKQQHELEAALEHYVTYGDSDSLQRYLSGYKTVSSEGSSQPQEVQQPSSQKQQDTEKTPSSQASSSTKSSQKEKDAQDCEDDVQSADKHTAAQDRSEQQGRKKDAIEQAAASQPQQQQASSQTNTAQQSKKSTGGYTAGSSSNSDAGNSRDNSIWGYTPPTFTPEASGGPATVSLYAASSSPFQGHATFYSTGMGACGVVNSDNQPIVAVSRDIFEQYNPSSGNPNHNSLCGKRLEITWNGKKQQAFAMDECPGCKPNSLDLSPNLFKALDDPDKGDLDGITWKFI